MIGAGGVFRSGAGVSAQVLIHFDGVNGSQSFPDAANGSTVWTPSGATPTLSTADAILGSAALLATGNNEGISAPWPTGMDFSGEFTVAFRWVCPSGLSGDLRFFTSSGIPPGGGANNWILVAFIEAGALNWYTGLAGATDTRIVFSDFPAFVAGNEYAIAFSRDASNIIRCAVNGVVSAVTSVNATDWTKDPSVTFYVGTSPFPPNFNFGVLDEFMVTKHCLFTANYTVQTVEFTPGGILPF